MNILKLNIESFLGVRNASLEFEQVNIIAGDNWAGKSSIQQALRITTSGEVARVKLKGEYGLLVREGSKKAELTSFYDDGTFNVVSIPLTGKATIPNCDSEMVKMVLDQERFMGLDDSQMRKVIFDANPQIFNTEKIVKRMGELGADATIVEAVLPLLRDSFEAAESEAEQQLKNFRAKWKAVTGETYGSEKAETWEYNADVESLSKQAKEYARLASELNDLEGKILAKQSDIDNARLNVLKHSLDYTCENCQHEHKHDEAALEEAKKMFASERGTLEFLERTKVVVSGDLKIADEAAQALEKARAEADSKTQEAAQFHDFIKKWAKLKELLSPSGIMAELIADALAPINKRLQHSAEISGLGLVQIRHDMAITLDNRLYGLCSESQRWIVQAMICEALSNMAGLGLVVLDRIDVLSIGNRAKLLKWCLQLSKGTQFILFGTLKSKPEIAGIKSFWVEDGTVT
jgi:hypothetical protein